MNLRLITPLLIILALLSGAATAQVRNSSLAVNGTLVDDAGPYYFGGSDIHYAQAVPLARALGLNVAWNGDARTLTFSAGNKSTVVPTTPSVSDGLVERAAAYTVAGTPVTSAIGIVVSGTSYVPIEPLARAFGFETGWHAGPRVLTVDTPAPPPAPAAVAASPATTAGITTTGPPLPAFRAASHDDYTRIAIDLGDIETFTVAVGNSVFTISFDAGSAPDTAWRVADRFVRSAYYTVLEGKPSLVVNTQHQLGTDGSGFRIGMTDTGTVYVDFAPGMKGNPQPALSSGAAAAAAAAVPTPGADTTAAVPAPVISGGPAAEPRRVIVLDPGHGGVDPGAVGFVVEQEVVLAVAKRVRALLEADGIEVIMTREDNSHLSANKRADLAMRADMATPDRNLFVSIHANSFGQQSANGIETWVFGQPLSQANLDRAITENGGVALTELALEIANDPAVMILRETQLRYSERLAEHVQAGMVQATGAVDRGVKRTAFYVLSNARTPSILIEIGFVSNPTEGPALGQSAYQDRLARGIAGGILDFMNNGGLANR